MPFTAKRPIKTDDPRRAFELMARYCAFRERSRLEVVRQLDVRTQLEPEAKEQIIEQLVAEGFLNETRFAHAFARGKYNGRAWGRQKIKDAMRQKGIPDAQIREALEEVTDEAGYLLTMRNQLEKRHRLFPEELPKEERFHRLFLYGLRKGYEVDLMRKVIPTILTSAC